MHSSNKWGDFGLLALRIVIAIIFLYHGLYKFSFWTAPPPAEMPVYMLWIFRVLFVVEPIAGILILVGWWTRWAALVLAAVMLGAIYFKVSGMFGAPVGFADPGGWNYDFSILGGLLALAGVGAGCYAAECKECWGGKGAMTPAAPQA